MNHLLPPRYCQPHIAGPLLTAVAALLACAPWSPPASAAEPSPPPATASNPPAEEFQIEVTKKGLGKEVSIRRGSKEWFMMIEVTPDNTVVLRQEKENENLIVDESETHDRAMSKSEVDAAIENFITSVKAQVKGTR